MNKQLIKLAETTLSILERKKWHSINFEEIVKKAKLNNNNFNKHNLLTNINRYFDFQLKKFSANIELSNNKDMIFEVMMLRFDLLQKNRKAIINIFRFFKKNPPQFVLLLPSFIESIIIMVSLTKIPINGLKGNLTIKILLTVYFASFLVWIKDNSTSMEKTMTSLDNYLDRADNLINIFKK